MPEHSDKVNQAAAADAFLDDQEDFEVEEEEIEVEEEEEDEVDDEDGSEGEEKEADELEEGEDEEMEEDECGDSEREDVNELEEGDLDHRQQNVDDADEGSEGEEKEVDEMEEGEEEDVELAKELEEYEDGGSEREDAMKLEEGGLDHGQKNVHNADDEAEVADGKEEDEDQEIEGVVEDKLGDSMEQVVEKEEEAIEGRVKEETDSGVSFGEVANAVPEGANDLSEAVKSEVFVNDQNAPIFTSRDCNTDKNHAIDPSKIFSANNKVLGNTNDGHGSSGIIFEPVLSNENGISETSLIETCKGVLLKKETSHDNSKLVKSSCVDTHESQRHSLNYDNVRSLQPVDVVRNEPEIVNHNISGKGEVHIQDKKNLKVLEDSIVTLGRTSQRRPRSSSPGSESDKMNKKPANICVFFARGWCIKGASCKFLHQKDGDHLVEQGVKERKAEHMLSNSLPIADEINKGSNTPSAQLDSTSKSYSECKSLLQRALIRTYGTGSSMPPQFQGEEYDLHSRGRFQQRGTHPSVQEEYHKTIGKRSHFESIGERHSEDALFSRNQPIEGKLVNKKKMDGSFYNIANLGSTHLVDSFGSNSNHYSGGSSLSLSLHQNMKISARHFVNKESYDSHSLPGSLNSAMGGSFQQPHLNYRLSRAGTSPTLGPTQNSDYFEGRSLKDQDRRYHTSGTFPVMRDSSSYQHRPELQHTLHHTIPSDPASMKTTKVQYDAWEPSQPFRSSLAIETKHTSSPASQYDPILDSIEPAMTTAGDCFQASQLNHFQNVSSTPTKTDNFTQTKSASLHESIAYTVADTLLSPFKSKEEIGSFPGNENSLNPNHSVEILSNKDAEIGSELKIFDKSRNIKESKAFKNFHTALVDSVKDILKPWWRDGHLSKDGHKTIVKKSVEKVLSALQSHQIPSTQESINQYLVSSRQKILKLVEGYVQKHSNSRDSDELNERKNM